MALRDVAWVGETYALSSYLFELKEEFRVNIEYARLADKGLALLTKRKFDLIFIKDEVASGKLVLPQELSLLDY